MHLAFCSDIEAFKKDRLRNKQWSLRFPGSGWITCLYLIAEELGIDMVSGDVALENIASNKWVAKDVFVIQDMVSNDADKLLDFGAFPFLITCLEAPLYAPFFYEKICQIAQPYRFKLGFGLSDDQFCFAESKCNFQFRFPSYYLEDMQEIQSWGSRKKLALVAANKYRTNKIFIPNRPSAMNLLRQIKSLYLRIVCPVFRKSLAVSLHDERLEAIEFFSASKELGLYGAGWDCWDELPTTWVNRLKEVTRMQYLGRCESKLSTIGSYRFSICFENMVQPGYVTEKLIDCFVAGTVPMYLGAPDIESYVPINSFIDMRAFDKYDQVDALMNSMDEQDALDMINSGRDYLKTNIGQLHSYEGFAANVINLVKRC